MTFYDMKTLETERLLLRRIRKSDAADMYAYASDPEVSRYLTWSAHESLYYTKGYIRFLIKKYKTGEFYDWGVEEKASGRFIGTCGFTSFDPENGKCEIGYVICPEFCRRGYATEAVLRVIRYAFEEIGLHRVEARIMQENVPSQAVAKKCGMTLEGTGRDELFVKGEYRTVMHYALLSPEDTTL